MPIFSFVFERSGELARQNEPETVRPRQPIKPKTVQPPKDSPA